MYEMDLVHGHNRHIHCIRCGAKGTSFGIGKWYSTYTQPVTLQANVLYPQTTKPPSKPYGIPRPRSGNTFSLRQFARSTGSEAMGGRSSFDGSQHMSECRATKPSGQGSNGFS